MRDRLDSAEDFSALTLSFISGINRDHVDQLRRGFETLSDALRAGKRELVRAGLTATLADRLARGEGKRECEAVVKTCELLGVRWLLPHHREWPRAVEGVDPRPMALYLKGPLPIAAVAVVGSRRSDLYGLRFARRLGHELARAGLCVVSGGALGVDGAAHRGALDSGVRHATLAVLGCGIDVVSPPRHRELFAALAREGALLSEFAPGTLPFRSHFPHRNRLIAALSSAVVVVRAARRSGSLVTARWARQLGIPVLATPGPAGDALSEGTHELLRSGASICATPEDVLLSIGRSEAPIPPPSSRDWSVDLDQRAARLLRLLSRSPASLDELGLESGMESGQVAAWMTRLELMGLAERRGSSFVRPI
jgi:DNA processing protein